jgi:hypothetical protein
MRIFLKQIEPQILELDFKESELADPIFDTALSRLRNIDEFEVHKKAEIVTVTVIDEDSYQVTGASVDEVRQIFCGDILEDADLSKCPQFLIGDYDEPEVEELDELGVQDTIQ